MSRFAVSCEHLAITAHFDEVILPSNPFSNRFSTLIWRSFSASAAARSQNWPLATTAARTPSAPWIARPRQSRNQRIQAVTSVPPFWVRSNSCQRFTLTPPQRLTSPPEKWGLLSFGVTNHRHRRNPLPC